MSRMSSMVSVEMRGRDRLVALDFRFHSSRKPSRCQRRTVSGFTSRMALCQFFTTLDRGYQQTALERSERGPLHLPRRDDQLLAEHRVLGQQFVAAAAQVFDESAHHRRRLQCVPCHRARSLVTAYVSAARTQARTVADTVSIWPMSAASSSLVFGAYLNDPAADAQGARTGKGRQDAC
jgi:hypothetical protein